MLPGDAEYGVLKTKEAPEYLLFQAMMYTYIKYTHRRIVVWQKVVREDSIKISEERHFEHLLAISPHYVPPVSVDADEVARVRRRGCLNVGEVLRAGDGHRNEDW